MIPGTNQVNQEFDEYLRGEITYEDQTAKKKTQIRKLLT